MLDIAICDDDAAMCQLLQHMIAQVNEERPIVQDMDTYEQSVDLWRVLQSGQRYDLIFLDVNMPGLDGIELGERIRQELGLAEVQIAYISGSAGYAMALYDNYPLRFLTKDDKLTLANVRDVLLRAEQLTKNGREKLAFIKDRLVTQEPIQEILYLESKRKQILLHKTNGRIIAFYDRLDNLEKQLKHAHFLRIHQSYLVNADKIIKIAPREVTLVGETKLKISNAYQKSALKWLDSLMGGDGK